MPTLTQGQSVTLQMSEGESWTVTPTGQAQISTRGVSGGPLQAPATIATATTFGPYTESGTLTIFAMTGSATYTGSELSALVSEDGNALWANRAALVAAGIFSAFFTDIGVGGSFWFYSGGRWRPSAGRVVLKNLTSSVTHSTTTRTVMDYATLPAGLWQDGDVMEMEWCKTLTGTDTDTTETALSAVAATFSDAMNLTTAALTNINPIVAARWRWRRLGATSVRPISISGSVGLGTAGAIPADPTVTTNLDTTDAYLQISGKLTTGGGPVTSLRAFTVTLICGS